MNANNESILDVIARRIWTILKTRSFSNRVWIPADYPQPIDQQCLDNCKLVVDREIMIERLSFSSKPIIAEIGVLRGDFSSFLLNCLSPQELHLFDLDFKNQKIEDLFAQEIQSSQVVLHEGCLLYTSPSPRDQRGSRMPSSA